MLRGDAASIVVSKQKKKINQTELKIRLNSADPLHSSKSQLNSAPQASLLQQCLETKVTLDFFLFFATWKRTRRFQQS